MNEEILAQLNSLEKRVKSLEEDHVSALHAHNGNDSNRIKIRDLESIFYAQVTWNPGSLNDGAGETKQITAVAGVNLGDFVIVAAPYDLQDMTVTGYVQSAGVVEIRLQNESGSTVDLASGVWRVLVLRKII